MDSNDPPPAPDPAVVAAAQTKSNRDTAISNTYLNRIDQYTPNGSSTYQITGYGPNGEPLYRQDTKLSDGQQKLYDSSQSMAQGMGDIGNQQLDQLKQQYAEPFNLDAATGKQMADMQHTMMDPVWDRRQSTADNQLIQRGFSVGDEGYTRGMQDFSDQRDRAYLGADIGARQQGVQEALAQRQLPLTEFNSLRTGAQPQQPTFNSVPQSTQANTDVAGIYNQAYQNQMAAYNAQNGQNNAMMGGLFQMGAAALPLAFSDRRLKRDIEHVGKSDNGLNVYDWTYIWGGARQRGYMADEVEALYPHAVHEIGGFKALNYAEIP